MRGAFLPNPADHRRNSGRRSWITDLRAAPMRISRPRKRRQLAGSPLARHAERLRHLGCARSAALDGPVPVAGPRSRPASASSLDPAARRRSGTSESSTICVGRRNRMAARARYPRRTWGGVPGMAGIRAGREIIIHWPRGLIARQCGLAVHQPVGLQRPKEAGRSTFPRAKSVGRSR